MKELRAAKDRDAADSLQDIADDIADLADDAKKAHDTFRPSDRQDALDNLRNREETLRGMGETSMADALDREIRGMESRFYGDDFVRQIKDAQAFFDAGDATMAERTLERAQAAIDKAREIGAVKKADAMQVDLDAKRDEFNQVAPMEYEDGLNRADEAVDDLADKYREEGPEGRAKARDLRPFIRGFRDILEKINNATSEEDLKRPVEDAEISWYGPDNPHPELHDVFREVIAGNVARVRAAFKKAAGGGAGADKWDSDPVRIQQKQDLEELAAAVDLEMLGTELYNDDDSSLPAGWSIDEDWSYGSSNGETMRRLIAPSGQMYYIKQDYEGAQAEADYAGMLNELGLRAPVVSYDGNDEGWFVLGHVGGAGVSIEGEFAEAFRGWATTSTSQDAAGSSGRLGLRTSTWRTRTT